MFGDSSSDEPLIEPRAHPSSQLTNQSSVRASNLGPSSVEEILNPVESDESTSSGEELLNTRSPVRNKVFPGPSSILDSKHELFVSELLTAGVRRGTFFVLRNDGIRREWDSLYHHVMHGVFSSYRLHKGANPGRKLENLFKIILHHYLSRYNYKIANHLVPSCREKLINDIHLQIEAAKERRATNRSEAIARANERRSTSEAAEANMGLSTRSVNRGVALPEDARNAQAAANLLSPQPNPSECQSQIVPVVFNLLACILIYNPCSDQNRNSSSNTGATTSSGRGNARAARGNSRAETAERDRNAAAAASRGVTTEALQDAPRIPRNHDAIERLDRLDNVIQQREDGFTQSIQQLISRLPGQSLPGGTTSDPVMGNQRLVESLNENISVMIRERQSIPLQYQPYTDHALLHFLQLRSQTLGIPLATAGVHVQPNPSLIQDPSATNHSICQPVAAATQSGRNGSK